MRKRGTAAWTALAVGLVAGALLYRASIALLGSTIVDSRVFADQVALIEALEEDNRLLSDDLFGVRNTDNIAQDYLVLPYSNEADAQAEIAAARAAAIEQSRLLMITFGANWCVDCRTLHMTLSSDEVAEYTGERFMFVTVDVGEFNHNLDVAEELGVSLARGIPVAIFYDKFGELIGTTNAGELEPARLYSSSQILNFVRDIAENASILAPDAVR